MPRPRRGRMAYNDPCGYRRTTLNDGLTIRYAADGWEIASITSYQYSDDRMTLDQDFLPDSYFTLTQAKQDHGLTEDIVVRSRGEGRYGWLVGAFGFYRHRWMRGARTVQGGRIGASDRRQGRAVHRPPAAVRLRPHGARQRFPQPRVGGGALSRVAVAAGTLRPLGGVAHRSTSADVRAIPSWTDIDCTFGDGRITPFTERGDAAQVVRAAASQSGDRLPHRRRQFALRDRSPRVTRRADSTPRCSPKCCRTASWNAWASTGTVTTTSTAW